LCLIDFVVYMALGFMSTSTNFELIWLIHCANTTYLSRDMIFKCQFFVMLACSLRIDVQPYLWQFKSLISYTFWFNAFF